MGQQGRRLPCGQRGLGGPSPCSQSHTSWDRGPGEDRGVTAVALKATEPWAALQGCHVGLSRPFFAHGSSHWRGSRAPPSSEASRSWPRRPLLWLLYPEHHGEASRSCLWGGVCSTRVYSFQGAGGAPSFLFRPLTLFILPPQTKALSHFLSC